MGMVVDDGDCLDDMAESISTGLIVVASGLRHFWRAYWVRDWRF